MKHAFRILMVVALTAFLLLSPEARADNVVITGGNLTPDLYRPVFTLTWQGLTISGSGNGSGIVAARNCSECLAGSTVSLAANFAGQALGSGPGTVNGVSYPRLYYTGGFSFSGSVTLPNADSSLVIVTAPFTFEGTVLAYDYNYFIQPVTVPAILTTSLSGQGMATLEFMTFVLPNGIRRYSLLNITYTFQPAPIPEPTTLLLLGTGLTGTVAAVRRRRRTKGAQ